MIVSLRWNWYNVQCWFYVTWEKSKDSISLFMGKHDLQLMDLSPWSPLSSLRVKFSSVFLIVVSDGVNYWTEANGILQCYPSLVDIQVLLLIHWLWLVCCFQWRWPISYKNDDGVVFDHRRPTMDWYSIDWEVCSLHQSQMTIMGCVLCEGCLSQIIHTQIHWMGTWWYPGHKLQVQLSILVVLWQYSCTYQHG